MKLNILLLTLLISLNVVPIATTAYIKIKKKSQTQNSGIAKNEKTIENISIENENVYLKNFITNTNITLRNQYIYEYLDKVEEVEEYITEKSNIVEIVSKVIETTNIERKYDLFYKAVNKSEILEQTGPERPDWTKRVPIDKNIVYIVGKSFGQEDLVAAYQEADLDALEELCQYVRLNVDMVFKSKRKSSKKSKDIEFTVNQKIVASSTNTLIRGAKNKEKFYIKYKANKNIPHNFYEFYLLKALPKSYVDKIVEESMLYEKELIKSDLNEKELKQLEKEIKNYNSDLNRLAIEQKLNKQRLLLFSEMNIENLNQIAAKAYSNEIKGNYVEAKSQYDEVLNRIDFILAKIKQKGEINENN